MTQVLTPEEIERNNAEAREKVIREIRLVLGEGIVDIELDPDHYHQCLKMAFDKYRMKSSNAVEEGYYFLELQREQYIYYLPKEIVEVRSIFRRGVSGGIAGGAFIDPFALAFTNAFLLNVGSGAMGSIATYDFFASYQETLGRLFGRDINFAWEPSSRKLTIMRNMSSNEQALLWVYIEKPEFVILNDPYSYSWIKEYSIAQAKMILGEARSKFGSIPGPQGGSQLNGSELKQEAREMIEKLEADLFNNVEQRMGYGFLIG